MHDFAIIIGKCSIVPASPKLALLLIMWMFGADPSLSYTAYRDLYIANGGKAQVAQIEQCFADYPLK